MLTVLILLTVVASALGCPGVTLVSRSDWGADRPKATKGIPPMNKVFIHHTSGWGCRWGWQCRSRVRGIQDKHMGKNGWDDIGYNFLIGGDGRVYVGRGWDREGAHTYGYNDKAIAIAFIGNFKNSKPSSKMQTAAKKLIACGVSEGHMFRNYGLYGHRDVNDTECPGNSLYKLVTSWRRWHELGTLPFKARPKN